MTALPPWPRSLIGVLTGNVITLILMRLFPQYSVAGLLALVTPHAVLAGAGLCPRCTLLGPNLSRWPTPTGATVHLTFDDGPDPLVTPAVLDLLQRYGAQASFFCIGDRAARHPDLCRAICAAGHTVENHGQRHGIGLPWSGRRGWQREVDEGQATLQAITGIAPRYYRAMAGLRNPFLAPLLQQRRLALASWTRRGYDTRSIAPERVLARLLRDCRAGDILLLHDGHAGRSTDGQPLVLVVLPTLLETLQQAGFTVRALPDPAQTQW